MSKIDVINQTISVLPDSYDDKYLLINNEPVPFYNFLTSTFLDYVNDEITVDYVLISIEKLFKNKLKTVDDIKLSHINAFIENNNVDEEIASWLRTVGLQNMDASYLINHGNKKTTLQDYYKIILKQKEEQQVLDDRKETCEYYLEQYLEKDLYNFYIEQENMTVYEYVTTVIPEMMIDYYQVTIGDNTVTVEELISDVASQVYKEKARLETKENELPEEEQIQNKNQFNNVLGVPTFEIERKEDNTLEITGKLPIIITELSKEDKEELISSELSEKETKYEILSSLKKAAYEASDKKTLDAIKKKLDIIKNELSNREEYEAYISSIEQIFELKEKSLIITNANKEEYVDAIASNLVVSSKNIDYTSNDSLDNLVYLTTKASLENSDKINSPELKSEIDKAKKTILLSSIKHNSGLIDRDKYMFVTGIESESKTLKLDKQNIEQNDYDNNFVQGKSIFINERVKELMSMIEETSLTEEEKNNVIEMINRELVEEETRSLAA